MNTVPTELTELQYEKAIFAIDRKNADHYLIFGDVTSETELTNTLWVGRDEESLQNTTADDFPTFKIDNIDVIGEDGIQEEIEAITFSTKDSWNNLDLQALSQGCLSWK